MAAEPTKRDLAGWLMAARASIAERDAQIAALRHSLHQVFQILRGHDCAESILISAAEGAAQIVVQERDSLRGELEAARESYRRLEPCGHPGNFQMGDEHGHFTCAVCERGAALAGCEVLSAAEQRGYERGKAEENEAYEREVFRQIAKAKAEGEIAGLQQAADFAIDCNLDTFAHSLRLKAGNREHKRQLIARRGKEEEERKDGE